MSEVRWRSPLEPSLAGAAEWLDRGDGHLAEVVDESDAARARHAGLCDLSPLPRLGARGAFAAPLEVNAVRFAGGAACCRLSDEEAIVLADALLPAARRRSADAEADFDRLEGALAAFMPAPRLHIPRRDSHCQIGLCGGQMEALLSRLCLLPPPASGEALQTRVADIDAIVVGDPRARAVHLLAESSFAIHLWEAISEAAKKCGGGPVGYRAWRTAAGQSG